MRRVGVLLTGLWLLTGGLAAQAPAEALQPVATMKELMLDVIHPASNSLLIAVNRGGPSDDKAGEARQRDDARRVRQSADHAQPCGRLGCRCEAARDVGTAARGRRQPGTTGSQPSLIASTRRAQRVTRSSAQRLSRRAAPI